MKKIILFLLMLLGSYPVYAITGGGSPPLKVTEIDGSPVSYPNTIKFPNGSLSTAPATAILDLWGSSPTINTPITFTSTATFNKLVNISSLNVYGTVTSTSGFCGVGSSITLLNASNLALGIVPAARLTGVLTTDTTNTFSAALTFTSGTFNGPITVASMTSYGTITSTTGFITNTSTIGGVSIPQMFTEYSDPTGFLNRTTSVLSWDDTSRTLTITGDHAIYIKGVRSVKPTTTKQIADTTGQHWIYYDNSGNIQEGAFPGFNYVLIALVYWNSTQQIGIVADERHGIHMDFMTHGYLHNSVGVRYVDGLTATFTDSTFSITAGTIYDEDIAYSITPAQSTGTIFYKNGSTVFEMITSTRQYFYEKTTDLQYNNGNTLSDVPANQYVAYWLFATNEISTPIVTIIGQRTDVTLQNARDNNKYESLSLGTLPFAEMKLIYRVIMRNTATPSYIETQDLRSVSNVPAGTYVASAHNALTGLDYNSSGHTGFAGLDVTNVFSASNTFNNTVNISSLDVVGTVTSTSGFVGGNSTFTKIFGNGSGLTGIVSTNLLTSSPTFTTPVTFASSVTFQGLVNVSSLSVVGTITTTAPVIMGSMGMSGTTLRVSTNGDMTASAYDFNASSFAIKGGNTSAGNYSITIASCGTLGYAVSAALGGNWSFKGMSNQKTITVADPSGLSQMHLGFQNAVSPAPILFTGGSSARDLWISASRTGTPAINNPDIWIKTTNGEVEIGSLAVRGTLTMSTGSMVVNSATTTILNVKDKIIFSDGTSMNTAASGSGVANTYSTGPLCAFSWAGPVSLATPTTTGESIPGQKAYVDQASTWTVTRIDINVSDQSQTVSTFFNIYWSTGGRNNVPISIVSPTLEIATGTYKVSYSTTFVCNPGTWLAPAVSTCSMSGMTSQSPQILLWGTGKNKQ